MKGIAGTGSGDNLLVFYQWRGGTGYPTHSASRRCRALLNKAVPQSLCRRFAGKYETLPERLSRPSGSVTLFAENACFRVRFVRLFQFKGPGIELVILPLCGYQFLMGPPLNHPPVVQHQYDIGVFHRGKPVGNDEHRAALHEPVHAA